jgi:hypothetical protein
MNEIAPPPDHYLRYCTRLALQGSGLSPLLTMPSPEPAPGNLIDIRAVRTMMAVEICRLRGDFD